MVTVSGRPRSVSVSEAPCLAYLVVVSSDLGRSFFELAPLPVWTVAGLGAIAALWTVAVLLVRRTGLVQRAIDRLIGVWQAVAMASRRSAR